MKKNDAQLFPGMFQREVEGISLLEKTESLHVPKVIANGVFKSQQFLISIDGLCQLIWRNLYW